MKSWMRTAAVTALVTTALVAAPARALEVKPDNDANALS